MSLLFRDFTRNSFIFIFCLVIVSYSDNTGNKGERHVLESMHKCANKKQHFIHKRYNEENEKKIRSNKLKLSFKNKLNTIQISF